MTEKNQENSFKFIFIFILIITVSSSGILYMVFRQSSGSRNDYPSNINPREILLTTDRIDRSRIQGEEYEITLNLNGKTYKTYVYIPPKETWSDSRSLPNITILAGGDYAYSATTLYYQLPIKFLERREELAPFAIIVPETMDRGEEFDEVFFRYIRPYILRNFPLKARPDAQIFAGIEEGGLQALRIQTGYNTGYGGLGLFSATVDNEIMDEFSEWLELNPRHLSFVFADIGESDPHYGAYLNLYNILQGNKVSSIFISRFGGNVPAFYIEAYYRYLYVTGEYFKRLEERPMILPPEERMFPLTGITIPTRGVQY